MPTFELSPDLDPKVAEAIRAAMDALRAEMAERFGARQSPAAPAASSGDDRLVSLERAVSAIDRAASQTELLGTLLRQAGGFAGRALFMVLKEDSLHGWAAFGFEASAGDVTGVKVEVTAGSPWRYAVDRNVAAELDAETCAAVCTQLDAAGGADGLIVPFALRGRVAGALYADRVAAGGAIDRPALRILTYVASQALETLPLRRAQDTAAVAEPEEDARFATTPSRETIPDMDVEDLMIQEVERDAAEVEKEGEGIVSIRRDVKPPEFEIVDEEVEAAPQPAAEVEAPAETATYDTVTELDEEATFATRDLASVDTTFIGAEPAAEPAESAAPEPEPAETAATGAEALQNETMAVTPQRQFDDAEVVPPVDLQGPGWAFGAPAAVSEDSRHEEARRLARLLVTEIKLYNEEKVREGREKGNIRDQLRDDIDRSRRIYEERIDDEVREATDYFHEECVRILAAGDSTALGA
jgi:hypothetical protein